jgi:hypothetical protein
MLCLINLLIDSISGSLMIAVQATGKIKYYQITVGILLFLNLPLSFIGLKYFNTPEIIFYLSIFISIIALIIRLFFLKNLINFPIVKYVKRVLLKILTVSVFSFALALFLYEKSILKPAEEIYYLVFNLIVLVFLVILICLGFGLDSFEKIYIKKVINERKIKKNNRE